MSFATLGLDPRILSAVTAQGYHTPTPIQQQTIPVILEGKDVLAGAQTGTGKTAAFTLPVLQLLSKNTAKVNNLQVRCLVLTPTRELAQQVADSVKAYGADLPLKYAVFYGGVSINPQYDQASRGLDILVATPGRLLDHLHQGTVSLSELQILVLDEADRMLDMGFIHDIKRIMARLPKERQTLFFSATFAKEIKELADTLLKSPVLIEVAKPNSTAEKIEQLAYRVDSQRKREMLSYLIGSRQWKQVLIFSRTKHGADRLAKQLRLDGIEAGAIHGDKSQGARTKALDDFKNNRLTVLVATDIAARGLDIEELPIVVNYDLPQVAEDYVHRIGRTGRAGNSGLAISLVTPDDLVMLQAIEKLTKQVITQQVLPGYEHDPKMNHSSKKADAEEERVQKVASRNKQLAKEKAKLRAQLLGKK
ncbi:DEAD/DEAH box helicase [Rheinheimera mesophila]|uniref:DEAD-box ATP-dependent RNA helicase RhpA n=1 Tax=Rheinheimera mesophila TaxID=1547515 RepID=A0A3P3QQP7_9GAMM|nr:DEAD/DEAH box helicase [Rheinheimera mesophila]KKL03223.1 ATP-dependent RNA helicase RhlE [Rheinheimera mesophila]RRJ23514.1 DEAD/DEAH box helicase [Rheinheimera mesophila]